MANYFTIVSSHKKNERDSFYSTTQLQDKKISIGWGLINPINKSKDEIKKNIEDFYPKYKSSVNPDNGAKSLTLFINLLPGDVIFVRGDAKIIDVIIITGSVLYEKTGHYPEDYYLKVPFTPLFSDKQSVINTVDIPESIYDEVLYEGGRSIVVRELKEKTARELMKVLLKNL